MSRSELAPRPTRVPAQPRGQRRVDAILEAAAALVAEGGLGALTMSAVAERSGSAMGSLYHFFPDRDALVDGLVARIIAGVRHLFPSILTERLTRGSIASFVRGIIEPVSAFAVAHPEFPELMTHIETRGRDVDREIAERLDAIVRVRAPELPDPERALIVRMMIGIVRAGIQIIALSPAVRAEAQVELESALVGYLTRRLKRP